MVEAITIPESFRSPERSSYGGVTGACVAFPALAFLIGYGMVTPRVGNGRILSSLVSLTLALGGVCGVAVVRSPARLPIRILGFLAALGGFFYAFVFLFSATIGFR